MAAPTQSTACFPNYEAYRQNYQSQGWQGRKICAAPYFLFYSTYGTARCTLASFHQLIQATYRNPEQDALYVKKSFQNLGVNALYCFGHLATLFHDALGGYALECARTSDDALSRPIPAGGGRTSSTNKRGAKAWGSPSSDLNYEKFSINYKNGDQKKAWIGRKVTAFCKIIPAICAIVYRLGIAIIWLTCSSENITTEKTRDSFHSVGIGVLELWGHLATLFYDKLGLYLLACAAAQPQNHVPKGRAFTSRSNAFSPWQSDNLGGFGGTGAYDGHRQALSWAPVLDSPQQTGAAHEVPVGNQMMVTRRRFQTPVAPDWRGREAERPVRQEEHKTRANSNTLHRAMGTRRIAVTGGSPFTPASAPSSLYGTPVAASSFASPRREQSDRPRAVPISNLLGSPRRASLQEDPVFRATMKGEGYNRYASGSGSEHEWSDADNETSTPPTRTVRTESRRALDPKRILDLQELLTKLPTQPTSQYGERSPSAAASGTSNSSDDDE